MAPDPLDRQAGVYARGMRLIRTPAFGKMSDQQKIGVLHQYYDSYVMPSYAISRLQPPDKNTWTREFMRPGGPNMKVSDFYLNKGAEKDAGTDLHTSMLNVGAAASRALANILNGPLVAGIKADQKLFGLKGYFPAPPGSFREAMLKKDAQLYADKNVKGYMRMNQNAIDDSNFWFQTRPSHTLSERAGSWAGEQAIMLPLYSAIGAPLKLGGAALTADKFLQSTAGGAAANLTRRCAASWMGKAVGNRLINAAEAYVGGLATGESAAQRDRNVLGFMLGGAVFGGIGEVGKGVFRGISKVATEKLLAENLAIGGVPHVTALTDQAAHELRTNTIGHDSAGQPIPAGDSIESAEAAFNHAHTVDPISTKTTAAFKVMLQQVTQETHGKKAVFQQLDEKGQQAVLDEVQRRTAKAAPNIPVHVPDAAASEIDRSIQEDIQRHPELKDTYAQLEQMGAPYGITVKGATQKAEVDAINDQTGKRSVQGAAAKSERLAKAQKFNLLKKLAESAGQPREKDPRNYVQFKIDTLSRFTNSINKGAKKADQTLAKFIKGMDDDDFAGEVKDHLGRDIHFEKPEDAMIWAIHHDDKVPAPIVNRAVRFMQDRDPTQTKASLKEQGKLLDFHIEMLAYTGKLYTEGNVFRSTITSAWNSRTGWQRMLMDDLSKTEMQEFNTTMGSFKKNFPEAYAQGAKQLVQMQALRKRVKTLEAAVQSTRDIRALIYKDGKQIGSRN